MNVLTAMMIEQKTRWALPNNKGRIRDELMRGIEMSGELNEGHVSDLHSTVVVVPSVP